jgi:hypothetical protein
MASGPSHPNEQLKKRSRGSNGTNGTANPAAIIGPHEQAKQAPVLRDSGPIGPHEQAAITVGGDSADAPPPPAAIAKSRARNGAGSELEGSTQRRLRFNVSLRAKLSKDSDFSVCVFSPDRDRGPVIIESIHLGVSRKGESIFDDDVPVRKETKVIPGTKKYFPFSDAQKKELARIVKSKTFALVSVVYTAPTRTEVTFSIENEDSKKK